MSATKPVLEPINVGTAWGTLGWLVRTVVPRARFNKYSCTQCFQSLWSILENGFNGPKDCSCWVEEMRGVDESRHTTTAGTQPNVFVIAYDGLPDKYARPAEFPNIHLDKIFSPVSLYLLLTERLSQSPVGRKDGSDYWLIIDPHERIDSYSRKIAELLHPFIQIINGTGTSLISALDQLSTEQSLNDEKVRASLESLKLLFTEQGNRHAVSNFIGPLLLGFRPVNPDVQPIVSYITHTLRTLKLIAPISPSTTIEPSLDQYATLRASTPLDFILVDDQISDGWDQLVATALGLNREGKHLFGNEKRVVSSERITLSTYNSAELILKHLENAVDNGGKFSWLGIGVKESNKKVLLLDLRLFEGRKFFEEVRFLWRVLRCAEFFCERAQPSSRPFGRDELDHLRQWLKRASEGDESIRTEETYIDAITLLPRILALCEPSLPIIIFSSMGYAIAGRFRDCSNVITNFEKPRLLDGQGEDLVVRTKRAFWSAIRKALELCGSQSKYSVRNRKSCSEKVFTTTYATHRYPQ